MAIAEDTLGNVENDIENDIKDSDEENEQEREERGRRERAYTAQDDFSIIRQSEEESGSHVPLWLVTFTDVMALMLTFFVLLYSMSSPQEEQWKEMSKGLTQKLNAFNAAEYKSGTQDVISLDKINTKRALDVGYIGILFKRLLKRNEIEDIMLIENGGRLVLSLPSDLLFKSGGVKINDGGRQALFQLGGVLSHVQNRIEVVGHSDPRPIENTETATYKTNWQLSLARAAEVAQVLKDVGYERDIIVRGLSSARYDELPEKLSQEKRYALSRRVDIIIMSDSGYRMNAFDM